LERRLLEDSSNTLYEFIELLVVVCVLPMAEISSLERHELEGNIDVLDPYRNEDVPLSTLLGFDVFDPVRIHRCPGPHHNHSICWPLTLLQ
jgi:hypothetical protein